MVFDLIPSAKIENIKVLPFKKDNVSQSIKADFSVDNFIKKIGRSTSFEPFFIKNEVFISALEDENRTSDIYLNYPSLEMVNIKVRFPKSYKFDINQTNVVKQSDYMDYTMKYFYDPKTNLFSLSRIFQKKKNHIKASNLDYIKEISRTISVADRTKLKLN